MAAFPYEVCTDCFEESGTNKRKVPRLLKSICLEIPHHKCVKVRVRMKNGVLEPEVRTIPKAHFKGEFVLCDPDRCGRNKRGKTCSYPHCLKEKAAWNAEKFGVVSSRVSPCWNARAIQRISDPEAMVFIVAARPLYILSMDITTCATTSQ